MRKPHLDFLSLTSRLLKALGASEGGCNVSGVFMDVAWDLACGLFWAAMRFERAYIAVDLAGAISVLPSCTVLHVLAYNLTRVMNIVGKPSLIAPIRAA